ncbi:N-acetyltransferase family protein [Umezawaea sp.]|uniref:GNAT family N-acetyltransferase n=1 Tax=Umezawaea sp. TaxID=1955258 RepID=UPI002ED48281
MSTIEEIVADQRVRDTRADDLPAIAAIYADYVDNTTVTFAETAPDAAEWQARLTDLTARGLPFLTAEVGGEVVGMAYCSPWKTKTAYRYTAESTIYLAPSAAGRGLGTVLLTSLVDRCGAAGIREIIAVVADNGNAASERLHQRCGFVEAGRLTGVGVKHGKTLDTVLLQRSLPSRRV